MHFPLIEGLFTVNSANAAVYQSNLSSIGEKSCKETYPGAWGVQYFLSPTLLQ